MKRRLCQFTYENNSWKRILEFIRQENILVKNHLAEVISLSQADQLILDDVEYLLNNLLQIETAVGLIYKDIEAFDKLTDREFFIDGNQSPDLHGTGTEDYFNTAWCPKEEFMTPYFGYPRIHLAENSAKRFDIGWTGRTHVYRFHITDPVYFDKSLKFSIEHGHNNVLVLEMRTVAYWYQSEAARIPAIKPKAERQPMPLVSPVDMHRWRDEWRKTKADGLKLWGNK